MIPRILAREGNISVSGNMALQRGDATGALAVDRETMNISPNRWQVIFPCGITLDAAGVRLEAQIAL
ncbi:MAG TPA: hypothetical protein VFK06_22740 [Candidatus Angelobacter sp.]|nr:hypothetical protein [Candidatus Angelobacter sp.]